ncbi:alpha/beta hydrolase [Henriciella barbarensis]|uniref:Alpha/beta hydrolase n=1 Tax=Henriciella barbarensis TaxID=86342 RepID=A0A399R140_9PROT|nr:MULTISPECIES: alpha/beta hydrolase [Henriciella]RIJ24653.1 alpha/beta hydrolase [Henriciella barbarensis]
MTEPIDEIIQRVLSVYKGWGRDTTVAQMRADWDLLFGVEPMKPAPIMERFDGVEAAWVGRHDLPKDKLFVYLHGGGYQVGSLRSHFDLICRLSEASESIGLYVDYRCAPEYPFPAPIEDCLKVYRALLEVGSSPDNIAFVGDSAGGNLALATTLKLKAENLPLPAAIGLMSPWTDLEANGESYVTRAGSDPIHNQKMIRRMASNYLGGADAAQPLASPLHGDLSEMPPVFIQVGDRETVLSDACDMAAAIKAAGGEATCQVWDRMIHVFQQFPDELPEARAAIDGMAAFLRKHIIQKGTGS